MKLPMVENAKQVMDTVDEIGFLPLFRSSIEGFSLQEMTPPNRWFVEGMDGPWEWREVLAASDQFAYGKLFERKAGFISLSFLKDFINFRRDGYDFDAWYEDALASARCKRIVDMLTERGPMLSGELKRGAGFGKGKEKGYDGAMALLQMQLYVTVESFYYRKDTFGVPRGFGVGRYALIEQVFGTAFVESAYENAPEESKERIVNQLMKLAPEIDRERAEKFLKV